MYIIANNISLVQKIRDYDKKFNQLTFRKEGWYPIVYSLVFISLECLCLETI